MNMKFENCFYETEISYDELSTRMVNHASYFT